jgi:hypothetical protein
MKPGLHLTNGERDKLANLVTGDIVRLKSYALAYGSDSREYKDEMSRLVYDPDEGEK